MANTKNKGKRSARLTKPLPPRRKVEAQLVSDEVYTAIADLNASFLSVITALKTIGQIPYLRSPSLFAAHNLLCRTRAQITRDCLIELYEREMSNAAYYDRLCIQWEKENEALGV